MFWLVTDSRDALNLPESHLTTWYWDMQLWPQVIQPASIEPVVLADPDDDAVLACAIAAQAEIIVSGDSHLLRLSQYRDMPILTAAELAIRVSG
jgi:predicted nucleic acid-binding protein